MRIESASKTIQSCFRECLYDVPAFQRSYSWGRAELEDYWNDVVLAAGNFFFGTTVTWISEKRDLFNNTYSLIDGQQRITTSAIALSVVRDMARILADEHDEDNELAEEVKQLRELEQNVQGYLIARDDDAQEYPILKRPENMFWEVIQRPNSIPSGNVWDHSARRIGQARSYFEQEVRKSVEGGTLQERNVRLRNIRNNILQARIIQVELDSEEDAFLVFETLNTRGKELQLADLIKNMLTRGAASSSSDQQAVSNRWKLLESRVLSEDDNQPMMDRFIWQSWNSRYTAVKEPELYKRLKEKLGADSAAHLAYLEELELDAKTYRHLHDSSFEFPRRQKPAPRGPAPALTMPEVQDSIRALALFNVTVANSAVLALVRKYDAGSLLPKRQLLKALRAIENFHFQYTALASGGSTGGTRSRYNVFSVKLEEAESRQEVSVAVADLIEKLRNGLPTTARVEQGFKRLFYGPSEPRLTQAQKNSSRPALIRYVLCRIAQFKKELPAGAEQSRWTIEHIRPQSLAADGPSSAEYSIGNLVLLSEQANNYLGNANCSDKKNMLRTHSAPKDDTLLAWIDDENRSVIDKSEIEQRTHELACLAVESVWTLSQ
ncbi:GmrSD restriction endonuclease domain-containing protein [Brevibacterium gallinarum]|nr:DUF262 domain-containing protein [Brevibacterium gallinarum]